MAAFDQRRPSLSEMLSIAESSGARVELVGFWSGNEALTTLPDPRDFVDPDWDVAERDAVVWYLDNQGTPMPFSRWASRLAGCVAYRTAAGSTSTAVSSGQNA